MDQIHRRFSTDHVRNLLRGYTEGRRSGRWVTGPGTCENGKTWTEPSPLKNSHYS